MIVLGLQEFVIPSKPTIRTAEADPIWNWDSAFRTNPMTASPTWIWEATTNKRRTYQRKIPQIVDSEVTLLDD